MSVQLYDGPTGPLTLPQISIEAALERRRTLMLFDEAILGSAAVGRVGDG